MEKIANSIFKTISPFYMNRRAVYDDGYFRENHQKRVLAWYRFFTKMYYRYVAQYAMATPSGIQKGNTVLDIGCGIGILVEQFRDLGFKPTGIDISKAAIQNSISPQECSVVNTTAHVDYPENYFDLIVSREVLEHIPEETIDACIQEWDRVGKGKMVHLIAVNEHGTCALDDPTHVNMQPEQWWINKFQEHGYRVTRKPRKWFFSPFGNSGYLMMTKK